MHVTPAAISRLVQLLEERIGVALFEREPTVSRRPPRGAPTRPD